MKVTRASAAPLMAASSTISSAGSCSCGRHRNRVGAGSGDRAERRDDGLDVGLAQARGEPLRRVPADRLVLQRQRHGEYQRERPAPGAWSSSAAEAPLGLRRAGDDDVGIEHQSHHIRYGISIWRPIGGSSGPHPGTRPPLSDRSGCLVRRYRGGGMLRPAPGRENALLRKTVAQLRHEPIRRAWRTFTSGPAAAGSSPCNRGCSRPAHTATKVAPAVAVERRGPSRAGVRGVPGPRGPVEAAAAALGVSSARAVAEAIGAKPAEVRPSASAGVGRRTAAGGRAPGGGGSEVIDRVLRVSSGPGSSPITSPPSWPRGQVVGWAGVLLAAAGGFRPCWRRAQLLGWPRRGVLHGRPRPSPGGPERSGGPAGSGLTARG